MLVQKVRKFQKIAMTVQRMANDVTYTMYAALPIHYVYNLSEREREKECVCVCVGTRRNSWLYLLVFTLMSFMYDCLAIGV